MATSGTRGTALITGASTGIGAAYAERLGRRGYDLILVARDQARLSLLADRIGRETGIKAETLVADLTDRIALATVEARLRDDASISMLVNNAGMAVPGPLLGADAENLEALILLNVLAPTRLANAAAPAFVARRRGTIVNIASVLALAPEMFNGAYSGTKAYVLNLTQALQKELAPHGVRVQAVLPGATRTEIWQRSGVDVNALPPEMLMSVADLVDAALAGLDMGEEVTIPPLADLSGWEAMSRARLSLAPHLSVSRPAARYGIVRLPVS